MSRDLFYKDMSDEGLQKLKDYGFGEHKDIDHAIYWSFPASDEYGSLCLYKQYYTDKDCTGEPSELVVCNGEWDLDDSTVMQDMTVEALEMICKLYKDGLVEFRDKKGSSYEIMKGRV